MLSILHPHNKVTLFLSLCKSESRGQFDEILAATHMSNEVPNIWSVQKYRSELIISKKKSLKSITDISSA